MLHSLAGFNNVLQEVVCVGVLKGYSGVENAESKEQAKGRQETGQAGQVSKQQCVVLGD